jgi:hypothetical protein
MNGGRGFFGTLRSLRPRSSEDFLENAPETLMSFVFAWLGGMWMVLLLPLYAMWQFMKKLFPGSSKAS